MGLLQLLHSLKAFEPNEPSCGSWLIRINPGRRDAWDSYSAAAHPTRSTRSGQPLSDRRRYVGCARRYAENAHLVRRDNGRVALASGAAPVAISPS
jgi:hypothetical protein